MLRKLLVLGSILGILLGETIYFGRQCIAAVHRLRGERAFFRNDHQDAWRHYQSAIAWGGDPDQLETDEIELLLFGLDQIEAGVKPKTPMPPDLALRQAQALVARRLRASPSRAYDWSLASDIFLHRARQIRRETSLDLTRVSEDPLANLSRDEWLGVFALEMATRWEPTNYLYQDLLVEFFLDRGSQQEAAGYCRRAVAAYPHLDEHRYLSRPNLAPEILDAAVQGFQDAAGAESLVTEADIACDTARLLLQNGQDARALPYLQKAVAAAPRSFLAHYLAGDVSYRAKSYKDAIAHLEIAARLHPGDPWPHFLLGRSHRALGEIEAAIGEMREAREAAPNDVQFFHGLGEVLEDSGRLQEAERQFVAAANLHPHDVAAWWALLEYYERHHGTNAGEVCATLLRLLPEDASARQRCARLDQGSP